MCFPIFLGSGTTQFHQGAVSANGIYACFYIMFSLQKLSKHPYGYYVPNITFLC